MDWSNLEPGTRCQISLVPYFDIAMSKLSRAGSQIQKLVPAVDFVRAMLPFHDVVNIVSVLDLCISELQDLPEAVEGESGP